MTDGLTLNQLAEKNALLVSEVEQLNKKLLAYEQAAKNPIGSFHISGGQVEATTDYCRDGEWPVQDGEVLVYAAPVLPKQPEPVALIFENHAFTQLYKPEEIEIAKRTQKEAGGTITELFKGMPSQPALVERLKKVMNSWLAMEPKLAFQPEFTDVMMLLDAKPAPAQPVIPEQRQRISDDDFVSVPRSVLACAGYAYRKAGLKDRKAYAELKKYQFAPAITAQPVSEPYKLPDGWKLVPIEPTAAMFHAFNDCDYGRKSMRERYIQMIEAAPTQESE